ncbi:sigma-54-dependent Fis family transcriptional regulator [Methylobacillus gramineus]|uniref:sigma-54-dependent Fis family transcriptional regulator n=1 Tax=Methylobacillus gramineus TaxID=755169 RepID=UPI001CFFD406|nr:sigma-54-dependent Fis family transcriptional regulator [Methylobacillus gramineus]MCB5185354.1 sigma-54-dependent Fis family transcriptional regulator [Methylobacillus gramineus]
MNHPATKSLHPTEHARLQFLADGNMQEGVVSKTIAQSWQRSLAQGINAALPLTTETLSKVELEKKYSQNHLLLTQARPEIATLYEQIAHSYSAIALTDAKGVILHSEGHDHLVGMAPAVMLSPGYSWSEEERGTNAIGTAIIEEQPVAVQGAEHFVAQLHLFSCYAVPIFGANHQLIGTLNVSNAFSAHQQHTLALVKMAAQMIENRIFRASHQGPVVLRFHNRPEFIGTLWEGTAVFSHTGALQAINRNGMTQLACQAHNLPGTFEGIFHQPFNMALGQATLQSPMQLAGINGSIIHAQLDAATPEEHPASPISRIKQPHGRQTLDHLNSSDTHIQQVVAQARLVMNQDIPILIEGETGVGKELFASAIHYSSNRSHGPLIAVNCAALPEGLIEAELFGYEEGAFTGARQKGSQGKIEQANGGTLFLDEIGDMPLLLQARLLRVLQERSVTPLGGSKSRRLDFAVISATNQTLQAKVASGEFRKDLYYRLNGLSLTLPPLRERSDLNALLATIVQSEQYQREISADIMQIFRQHAWPGNIRQLRNVVKTAIALADGKPIQRSHLPNSFMQELASSGQQIKNADSPMQSEFQANGSLDEMTQEAVKRALENHEGNISAAARSLGMSRNRLYRKLKALGMS